MILADEQIRSVIKSGEIEITPFDPDQIEPASIDLRVGDYGATTKSKQKVDIKNKGFLLLEPGGFGVVECLEVIKFGAQYAGRIGLRSKYARKGIIATTGPQIDPGYHGRLVLGLTNLTPRSVSISHGSDILTLEIHKLSQPAANPYSGPYQGRLELGAEELEAIAESEGLALSEMLTTLRTLTTNVGALTDQMGTFKWVLGIGFILIAIMIAVVGLVG